MKRILSTILLTLFFCFVGTNFNNYSFANEGSVVTQEYRELQECKKLYYEETPKSWKKGFDICDKLASNGNAEAQYYTGMMLKEQINLEGNKEASFSWFYLSEQNSYKPAKREREMLEKIMTKEELGGGYYALSNTYSKNITKFNMISNDQYDDKKSFGLLEKSADYGDKFSQTSIAVNFIQGKYYSYSYQKNCVKAFKWAYLSTNDKVGYYRKNIENIEDKKIEAKAILDKIIYLCDEKDIQKGQALSEIWINNNKKSN